MNTKDLLQMLSIFITLPLMGVFIIVLALIMLFNFILVGPSTLLTKIGVFNGNPKTDRK